MKKQEKELFEFHIKSFYRNSNLYLTNTIFGYVMSTLLFGHLLTRTQHTIILSAWIGFLTIVFFHSRSVKKQDNWLAHPKRSLMFIFFAFVSWTITLNIYFVFMYEHANQSEIMGIVLLQIMLVVVNIAIVGLFEILMITLILLTSLHVSIRVWLKDPTIFTALFIPSYLMVVYFITFLRNYNRHIIKLFMVKEQNTSLFATLKQKNLRLEQSSQSQSRYLSAASHDLRQPLHALALLTNDAQRKNQLPEVAVTLDKIEQAIDSLSQSFNSMLNLSRLDAGVLKPEFKAVPLQKIFNRIHIEFSETALRKGLNFKICSTRVWVHTDEGMLHSILSNFVSNALRYTVQGRVLLGVRRNPNGTVRILVYDTGSGVPAEKASQIFQEYKRLESAEQRVKGGVGLGLAISERMARLLKADLLIESTLGKGSCFGLVLNQVAAPKTDNLSALDMPKFEDVLQGKRVAILDDDETAIEYLYELLNNWGLEPSIILSSLMLEETILDEGYFDLVISDYHLGFSEETGLDILIQAQSLQKSNPPKCILITGDTSTELSERAQAFNIELIYKPIRPVRMRSYLNGLFKHNT